MEDIEENKTYAYSSHDTPFSIVTEKTTAKDTASRYSANNN